MSIEVERPLTGMLDRRGYIKPTKVASQGTWLLEREREWMSERECMRERVSE